MVKFTMDETIAVMAIRQLINDWAFCLDRTQGLEIGPVLTEDCEYGVGETVVKGRAAVVKSYEERMARFEALPEGPPKMRHLICNMRVKFLRPDAASLTFNLAFFSTIGRPGVEHADIGAVADVRMNCVRDADGEWLISKFDSNQPFRRAS